MVCQKKGERICKNAENGWNPTIGGRWVVFGTGTNVFAHCDTCVTCREVLSSFGSLQEKDATVNRGGGSQGQKVRTASHAFQITRSSRPI